MVRAQARRAKPNQGEARRARTKSRQDEAPQGGDESATPSGIFAQHKFREERWSER